MNHFQQHDPILYSYIKKVGLIEDLKQSPPESFFSHLCREIIFQQLSDKAGTAILKRFENLFPQHTMTPEVLMNTPHESIRGVGLSHAKARYVKNIAEAINGKTIDLASLPEATDEKVIQELTKIKGVGKWTAEMFLMFVLGREDIFSFGDLGLRNGLKKVYGIKKNPSDRTINRIVNQWKPFRTYGCLILWRSLDVK